MTKQDIPKKKGKNWTKTKKCEQNEKPNIQTRKFTFCRNNEPKQISYKTHKVVQHITHTHTHTSTIAWTHIEKEAHTDLRNREWLMKKREIEEQWEERENVRTDWLQSTVMDDWLDNA